jgi:glutamate/tyrosine decarboxylase-like PLP-dependent enzyme
MLLTRYFHEEVEKLGFEVGPEPELSIATYRWVPERGDADDFNRRLLDEILKDGRTFVSSTLLNGHFVLRAAILSFRTRLSHVERYLRMLEDRVTSLEAARVG